MTDNYNFITSNYGFTDVFEDSSPTDVTHSIYTPVPSCSNLTTSLVNDSLKFTSSDTQICCNFWLKKNVSIFCSAKATHIFSAKNSEYCILNPLKQLMK